jgi:hypothetical protein
MMVRIAQWKRQHYILEDSLLCKELDKCDKSLQDSDALKDINIESRDEDGKKDQGPGDLAVMQNKDKPDLTSSTIRCSMWMFILFMFMTQ